MLMGHAVSDRRRALLICDDCGCAMREIAGASVDDLAAAAMRAGWRVKSSGAAGSLWVCRACDEDAPTERRPRDCQARTS
jgi:hypothetical protein